LIIVEDPLTNDHLTRIVEFTARQQLPSLHGFREFVVAGGLISYGANVLTLVRRTAYYVDKILKGTKPSDLPVEQPTKFQLVINMKTAKVLGLTVPPTLLARAGCRLAHRRFSSGLIKAGSQPAISSGAWASG